MNDELITHKGGCHCGRVRFEIRTPSAIEVLDCNCSICRRSQFLHVIVPDDHFVLTAGERSLQQYQFGTKTAQHLFCRICGVKAFYRPRSHPNSYSVNLRCIEQPRFSEISTSKFDGKNWEQARVELGD